MCTYYIPVFTGGDSADSTDCYKRSFLPTALWRLINSGKTKSNNPKSKQQKSKMYKNPKLGYRWNNRMKHRDKGMQGIKPDEIFPLLKTCWSDFTAIFLQGFTLFTLLVQNDFPVCFLFKPVLYSLIMLYVWLHMYCIVFKIIIFLIFMFFWLDHRSFIYHFV